MHIQMGQMEQILLKIDLLDQYYFFGIISLFTYLHSTLKKY